MTPPASLRLAALLAALACSAAPARAQQAPLGRLFATPDERATLDRQRDAGPVAAPVVPAALPAAAVPAAAIPPAPGMAETAAPMRLPPPTADIPATFTVPGLAGGGMSAVPGAAPPPDTGAAAPAPPPPSSSVELSGVLRGSSGRTTVWLNQTPQAADAKAGPGPAVSLPLSSGRRLRLKPGQRYDPANGSVQDLGR